MEGLFAYPCRRVATPAYPLGAKIRKNRHRCSPTGGFLCSFNTITHKSPHSKPFPIPFASLLGGAGWYENDTYGDVKYIKIGRCVNSSHYGDYVDFYAGWNTSRVQSIFKLVFNNKGCDVYKLSGATKEFFKDSNGVIYTKISGWQTTHFKVERALGYTTYYNEAIPESQIDISTLTPITVIE